MERSRLSVLGMVGVLVATVAVAVGAPPAGANDTTPNQRFVKAAYVDFLSRAPGSLELSTTSDALDAETVTKAAVVRSLSRSPEYVTALVQRMYRDTLGRAGDPGGVAYWTGQLRSGARSVASVAANLYASDEYFDGIGGPESGTNRGWLNDLYRKLLLREADPDGLTYWEAETGRTGRVSVARRFFQSPESAHTRVQHLYLALLGRPVDPGGDAYWSARVVRDGDLSLAANLAVSDEYGSWANVRFSIAALDRGFLAGGTVGAPYLDLVSAVNGRPDPATGHGGASTFTATGLPPGITMQPDGHLVGTPSAAGTLTVTITVHDTFEPTSTDSFTRPLIVSPALPHGCLPGGGCTRLTHGNGASTPIASSADGRYVVVSSPATDLVGAPDTNGTADVFLIDRTAGTTTRVSPAATGTTSYADGITADGRYVTYTSHVSGGSTQSVWDRTTATAVPAAADPTHVTGSGLSADRRYLARSVQTRPPGPKDFGASEVVLDDRVAGTSGALSAGDQLNADPSISRDGNHVVFWGATPGFAANLWAWDRSTGQTTSLLPVGIDITGLNTTTAQSDDGRFVTFSTTTANVVAQDSNGVEDVFVLDRTDGTVVRITNGGSASRTGAIAGDGRTVFFTSTATDLVPPASASSGDVYAWTLPG